METEGYYEYIIAGGGILGSAIAFSLSEKLSSRNKDVSIAVLDIDLDGEYSSTLKNAGGVRSTWRNRANVELCSYSINFYETITDLIDFRQKGYYWLHNDDTWDEIASNYPLYKEYGLEVGLYKTNEVQRYLPFVDNLGGVKGLSVSFSAGLIDHYSLREYYRRKARENGVRFLDRKFITRTEISGRIIKGIFVADVTEYLKNRGSEYIVDLLKRTESTEMLPENYYKCDIFINATGAWSGRIMSFDPEGEIYVKPRRRQMELVSCPELDLSRYGMVIDTSDVYFHGEGEYILVGYSNMDEPYGTNYNFDFYELEEESPFVEKIWKPLWNRISKFERLKFIRGWSGMYGETPDRSGYLGKAGDMENAYECCAHTGRGLMISYGAGEAMADLVVDGGLREQLKNAADLSRSRPAGPLYEQLHL